MLDNPPFSIMTQIVNFYLAHGVRFFLFAPHLTNCGIGTDHVCHVIENVKITYENGAVVNTSFVTNLDDNLIIGSPELYNAVKEANDKSKPDTVTRPAYEYPPNVLTATMVGYIVEKGVAFKLRKEDAFHVRALDHQRQHNKAIFGSGFLISDRAAQRKMQARKEAEQNAARKEAEQKERFFWKLSDAEYALIDQLNARSCQEKSNDEQISNYRHERKAPGNR